MARMRMRPLSLYVHIPFCRRKCAYCDFISFPAGRESIQSYIDAACSEIQGWAASLSVSYALHTVYFGGGTPSILDREAMEQLMGAIRGGFLIEADAEITMEANPGTFDAYALESWLDLGVNRLSLGVQSFDNEMLHRLGRIHTADQAERAYRMARDAGFDEVSMDLMFALPGQTCAQWKETLMRAAALQPKHLSCYSLIVEEGTPLKAQLEHNALPSLPNEDDAAQMQEDTVDILEKAGLRRYEISNYAVPGHESRHNLTYWRCGEYLGIGCAAHSDLDGRRFYNTEDFADYCSGMPSYRQIIEEGQDPEGRRFERIMLGLRTWEGVDCTRFLRDFGAQPQSFWPESIRLFETNGLLSRTEDRLRATRRGMAVLNALLVRMMEESDARIKNQKEHRDGILSNSLESLR